MSDSEHVYESSMMLGTQEDPAAPFSFNFDFDWNEDLLDTVNWQELEGIDNIRAIQASSTPQASGAPQASGVPQASRTPQASSSPQTSGEPIGVTEGSLGDSHLSEVYDNSH